MPVRMPEGTTTPMGPRELESLGEWLSATLGIACRDLSVELAPGGRSNLTFFVSAGDRTFVLRRPPLGHRLPTAHNVGREATVLAALAKSDVPVPAVLATCDDERVLGAPFFLMERVVGRFVREPADCDFTADEAARCSRALIDGLANIHLCRFEQLGLAGLGRPDGFLERQMRRWHEQLVRGRARETADLDRLEALLQRMIPSHSPVGLVHGDYRIDNVALDPSDPGRIVAVLDWEMATIGDPLTDVGMLLMYWAEAGEPIAATIQAVTQAPGFLRRDELLSLYAERTGVELGPIDFYVAFAHFKLSVIVEGIHARHLAGETVGPGFDEIERIGPALARRGLELVA